MEKSEVVAESKDGFNSTTPSEESDSDSDIDYAEYGHVFEEESGYSIDSERSYTVVARFQDAAYSDPLSLVDPSANLEVVTAAESAIEAIQILCPSLQGFEIFFSFFQYLIFI